MQTLLLTILLLASLAEMARRELPPRDPKWTPSAGCPGSISATIVGNNVHDLPSGRYSFPSVSLIHEALTTCPGIQSLSLRLASAGCSVHPDLHSLPFVQDGSDQYPALRELRLEDYVLQESEWDHVTPPSGSIWSQILRQGPFMDEWTCWFSTGRAARWWQMRKWSEYQRNKTNLELWADAMDWSQLEVLELVNPYSKRRNSIREIHEIIMPRLLRLKDLTLVTGARSRCAVMDLVSTSRSLQRLKLVGNFDTSDSTLEAILSRHGGTLERLELRHNENMYQRRPVFNASQIRYLATMAPNLKTLSIDLNQNGTWPFEELEIIASLPKLETAEIWFEYASEYARQQNYNDNLPSYLNFQDVPHWSSKKELLYQEPRLEEDAVEELWTFMRNASGAGLRQVTFLAGDWKRPYRGPLRMPQWFDQTRTGWICTDEGCRYKSERDEDPYVSAATRNREAALYEESEESEVEDEGDDDELSEVVIDMKEG